VHMIDSEDRRHRVTLPRVAVHELPRFTLVVSMVVRWSRRGVRWGW
jgi:hypothetical protein